MFILDKEIKYYVLFFQSQSAPMSTGSISDTELPARYRRQPLSEEEIAYINGGGIV